VLFSQGTPMILMGDEIGRTQDGNNNGYCQDNEINWLRWEDRDERDEEFFEFVRRLIAIRQEHGLLRQNRFLHEGTTPNGDPEICWLRPDGAQMESGDWENPGTRALMVMLNGEDESLLLLMNAHHEDVEFTLPERDGGWTLIVDTAHGMAERAGAGPAEANLQLPPRTLMLVEARNAHQ